MFAPVREDRCRSATDESAASGRQSVEKARESHWTLDEDAAPVCSAVAEQPAQQFAGPIRDRAQRVAILGELSAGILHEFNNILTVVSGTIDILAQAATDRPQLAAVVRLIDGAAIRGSQLTSWLQAFERGQPPRYRDVDVGALLAEAERLLRPVLGGRTEVTSSAAAGMPMVLADPGLLLIAILGLALAADGAMPHGGAVFLGSSSGPDEEGAEDGVVILLDATSHGSVDDLANRIRDGLGMAEAWLEQSGARIRVGHHTSRSASFEIHLPKAPSLLRG
jgi:hypothetical protein